MIHPFGATIDITIAALSAPSSGERSILSSQDEVTEFMTSVYEKCCELATREKCRMPSQKQEEAKK